MCIPQAAGSIAGKRLQAVFPPFERKEQVTDIPQPVLFLLCVFEILCDLLSLNHGNEKRIVRIPPV